MLQPHDVVLVVGKRGTGKSTHAKALCGEELKAGSRVAWFDPHDEYSRKGRKSTEVRLGPLRDRVTIDQLCAKPSLLDQETLSLSVVPEGDFAAAFEEFSSMVLATGGVTLGADEIGEYSDEANKALNTVATQSRHSACPVVLVAQRLTQIPKTARTQASTVVTFLQSNPEDLAALDKLTGDEDFSARVSRLGRGKFLTWRDEVSQ